MLLGHLLKRFRAFANKIWNKSEQEESGGPELSCLSKCEPDDFCWICMEGERPGSPLVQRCACPRVVHDKCIARWQLQSAGKKYVSGLASWSRNMRTLLLFGRVRAFEMTGMRQHMYERPGGFA